MPETYEAFDNWSGVSTATTAVGASLRSLPATDSVRTCSCAEDFESAKCTTRLGALEPVGSTATGAYPEITMPPEGTARVIAATGTPAFPLVTASESGIGNCVYSQTLAVTG